MTTPRSAIPRYSFTIVVSKDGGKDCRLDEDPDGEWMKAVDVEQDRAALLAEIQRLEAETTRALLRGTVKGYAAGESTDGRHWRQRAEAAEAENARLREQLQQTDGKLSNSLRNSPEMTRGRV